jgi:hypothetical protein
VYGPKMLKWSWLVTGAALACSSPPRNFSMTGDGGSSGQPPVKGGASGVNGGAANGGAANGGAANGGAANGGAVNGGAVNGGAVNGGAVNGGVANGGAANGGAANGGAANGGAVNGGAANGGAANGGAANGGAANGGAANGGTASGGAANGGAVNGGAPATGGKAGNSNEPTAGSQGGGPPCSGCLVGKDCFKEGVLNPSNPCQICHATLASSSFSPNTGAKCGSSATECSSQDTCDASGACQANDLVGMPCAGGACETGGVCKVGQNPFDCIAPSPPTVQFTAQVFVFTGTPPTAKGGVIADGRYTATRIDLYNSSATGVDIRTFEFKKGFVQAATRYYSLETQGAFIPEVRFAGSFTSSASVLKLDAEHCDPQYQIEIPSLPYTATANGLVTIATLADGSTIVTSYVRQ